jgi:ATP-dependent helicase/nuclease subunit B
MAAQGRRAWETPQILDWSQWLQTQWIRLLLDGKENRLLLTPLQEEMLWKEIVRPGVESSSLISPGDVARLASSAYALLNDYDATGLLRRGEWEPSSLEPEMFRKWAIEMEKRCERNHWLCEAKLPWAIGSAIRAGRLQAPPLVLWNGFDRLSPLDKAMRLALEEAGCRQSVLAWEESAVERLIAAPSLSDEFEACAVWARQQMETHPQKSIGILLPDVRMHRAEVDRIFRRIFTPPGIEDRRPPYEFTLGLPLADVPVVAAALTLLRWCSAPQQQETITWLMTTGFFNLAGESAILADADIKVRKRLSIPELEMDEALGRLSRFSGPTGGNWAVANWVRSMQKARAQLTQVQGKQRTCIQWVATIGSILNEAGWPGEREKRQSDSINFQARDRWQRALEEVSALSYADRRYDFTEFLAILASHARAIIFSPESLGSPITISGILESAGRSFDAVWILGATDKALPASARLHPLLPLWLQLETGMPGSSAAQDWQLAVTALERLRDSSAELIFSYAREGSDGAQRPSALTSHLEAEATAPPLPGPVLSIEAFTDTMAVPWPGGRAAGGQSVLKDQAACPFKAFAARRLAGREMPSLEPGLNAMERGNVVHGALATLWMDEKLRTSEDLAFLIGCGELTALIQHHVALTFTKYEENVTTQWERSYLHMEQERVCALVEQWLRYEARRKPFLVEETEKEETIRVNGLELNVRMDRIDKTDAGRLLIDYKTGPVKAGLWESDRPAEPQLPIYAVSGKVSELRDVLFAQVRTENTKYVSALYHARPDIFPENPALSDAEAGFHRICEEWTEAIHSLSRQFQQGIATVMPKAYPSTCEFCEFPGLCRVAEGAPELDVSEEDQSGDDE